MKGLCLPAIIQKPFSPEPVLSPNSPRASGAEQAGHPFPRIAFVSVPESALSWSTRAGGQCCWINELSRFSHQHVMLYLDYGDVKNKEMSRGTSSFSSRGRRAWQVCASQQALFPKNDFLCDLKRGLHGTMPHP